MNKLALLKLALKANKKACGEKGGLLLSEVLDKETDPAALYAAIEDKIKELKEQGHYFEANIADPLTYLAGPHTSPSNPVLNQLYKVTNAIGLTDNWPEDTAANVKMPGPNRTLRMIAPYAGFDPDYLMKLDPDIAKKLHAVLAAHEIFEKETLDKPKYRTMNNALITGATLGGLGGLLAGIPSKRSPQFGGAGLLGGAILGMGIGSLMGGENLIHWSSHAGPHVTMHEANLIRKLNDPLLREIAKGMRSVSKERRYIQNATGSDYGERSLSPRELKKLQLNNPNFGVLEAGDAIKLIGRLD